jgi:hypothetical protein
MTGEPGPTNVGGLIAEDGTGVPLAMSYCSALGAEAYHGDRGTLAEWIATGAVHGLLIDATRLIEARYRWRGIALAEDQGLGLPRADLVLGVPVLDGLALPDGRVLDGAAQVALAADAVAYLALRLHRERPPADGLVKVSESLPDITVRYARVPLEGYDVIDRLLEPLVEANVPAGYAPAVVLVVA